MSDFVHLDSFLSADASAVSVCGADAGLNMEAQLDSPQQGQLGASVGGRDNVRQACIVKTHTEHSDNVKPDILIYHYYFVSSAARSHH